MSQALNNKRATALGPGGLGRRGAEVGGQSTPSRPGAPPRRKCVSGFLPRRNGQGGRSRGASLRARLCPRLTRGSPGRRHEGLLAQWAAAVPRGPRRNGRACPTDGRASPPVTQEAARATPWSRKRPGLWPPQLLVQARGQTLGGVHEGQGPPHGTREGGRDGEVSH